MSSFVADNASGMAKMLNMLGYDDELSSVETYGCGAHRMNLLSEDIEISGVREGVVKTCGEVLQKHASSNCVVYSSWET